MDVIYECGVNFGKLIGTTYQCVVSKKRNTYNFTIDFDLTDFYHLAGLGYLIDIDIPKNRTNTIHYIKIKKITDELLAKSKYFKHDSLTNRDIQSRISELRFLEEYLDVNNMINIYNTRDGTNQNSLIKADYVIQSRRPNSFTDVYIFLRKRDESDNYLVVSFFVKGALIYSGEKLYWMLKKKTQKNKTKVLFTKTSHSKNGICPLKTQ